MIESVGNTASKLLSDQENNIRHLVSVVKQLTFYEENKLTP